MIENISKISRQAQRRILYLYDLRVGTWIYSYYTRICRGNSQRRAVVGTLCEEVFIGGMPVAE